MAAVAMHAVCRTNRSSHIVVTLHHVGQLLVDVLCHVDQRLSLHQRQHLHNYNQNETSREGLDVRMSTRYPQFGCCVMQVGRQFGVGVSHLSDLRNSTHTRTASWYGDTEWCSFSTLRVVSFPPSSVSKNPCHQSHSDRLQLRG